MNRTNGTENKYRSLQQSILPREKQKPGFAGHDAFRYVVYLGYFFSSATNSSALSTSYTS